MGVAKTVEEVLEEAAFRLPKPLKGVLGAFGLGSYARTLEATITHFRIKGRYGELGEAIEKLSKIEHPTLGDLKSYYRLLEQKGAYLDQLKYESALAWAGAPTSVGKGIWGYVGKPAQAFTAWGALFSAYRFANNTVDYQSRYAASQYFRRSYYI